MISLPTSRVPSIQVAILAALVIACVGFFAPLTTHAIPPSSAEIGDGGDGTVDRGGEITPATATVSLAATPTSVQQGYASQLSYSSSSVTSCSIDNGVGAVTANASGYVNVTPSSTTTYTITCQASDGSSVSATASVTVTAAPTPLTAYCEAGPDAAQVNETVQWSATYSGGSSSNLAWDRGEPFTTKICTGGQNYTDLNTCPEYINEGDSCSVEGQRCKESAGCDGNTYTDAEGQPNAHTTYGTVIPYTCVASGTNATYSYSWTGTDGLSGSTQSVSKAYTTTGVKEGRATVTRSTGGTASATCTATISPRTPTATLSANPTSVQSGSSSTLSWSSTNANACTLNEGIGSVGTSGSRAVTPGSTTTYTLMCTAPSTTVSGTWQYRSSDTSDFACPVTDINKAYSSVPNCPSNPQGKTCNTSSACKVNTVDACNIHTDIYECSGSASSPAQSATASATVTVTAPATCALSSVAGQALPITLKRGNLSGQSANSNSNFNVNWGDGSSNVYSAAPNPGATISTSHTWSTAGTYTLVADAGAWSSQNGGGVYPVSVNGNGPGTPQSCTVTVTQGPQADLTAGTVTPTSATAGTPVTLSATAGNTGNGASGAFPMLFQVQETSALFNSGYLAGLASGASAQGSASYTFPSVGSYQVRACANFNTAWTAITTESNYANNCGPWTTVTVASVQTPALSCSASASSVSPGQSVTYSANPSGGASGPYTWTAPDGGSYGAGSTATRRFSTPGTYAMSVDTSSTPASNCPNVTVAASWCMNRPTDLTITATPDRVRVGQPTTLTWSATGVNGENASCTVSGPGVSWSSTVTGVPQCSASGSANTTIQTQSTYTLTCAGVSESVTVNVIPNFTEF